MTNPTTHLLLAGWTPPSLQAFLLSGDHVGGAVVRCGKLGVSLDQLDEVAMPLVEPLYCLGDGLDLWLRS